MVSVALMPYKTDPQLVVDSNAVLALSIAGELLEQISRRNFGDLATTARC